MGAFFGKIQIRISKSKNGFWAFRDQKDHESGLKSTLRVDPNPDFEIHNLSVFLTGGEGFEKSIFGKRFSSKS